MAKFDLNELMEKNKCKSKFITEKSKDLTPAILKSLDETDRHSTINRIDNVLLDIEKSIRLESGIYELALVYAANNNINYNIIPSIYNDTLETIMSNIDPKSRLKSDQLLKNIQKGNILPEEVAFLSPKQLNPKIWSDVVTKKKYEADKEKNKATSNAYKCYKCGENKCSITQLQTRSADEPMTTFVTCLVCYNTFRK